MKFIMNYYFFIYIWKEIYIINMIQSQPKLCDFVSLSDTYIQVVCNWNALNLIYSLIFLWKN